MKKKLKVEFLPTAFKDIPEEDREEMQMMVEEMFEEIDDPTAIGIPVEQLPPGVKGCPHCGGSLESGPTFQDPDGKTVQIFDCFDCGQPFIGEPLN